jgi:hypothetical protein
MRFKWTLLATLAFASLSAAQTQAAVVAVMPVRGVNLSEGQCDAIGALFANAFARDSQVAVASPTETKRALLESKTFLAAAMRLGVAEYVELRAIQLGTRVTLAGILYAKDGREIFRAETAAPNLDDMDLATASLAHALIGRQPIPAMPFSQGLAQFPEVAPVSPSFAAPEQPKARSKVFGMKTGVMFPFASGRSFFPMLSAQFDGRIGTRNTFIEFGAGAAIPTQSRDDSGKIGLFAFFGEVGASFYLSDGSIAPYVGGGITPGIWTYNRMGTSNNGLLRCAVYGQAGVTFMRDSRTKLYAEFRLSQHILGFADDVLYNSNYNGKSFYPTLLALHFGVGW